MFKMKLDKVDISQLNIYIYKSISIFIIVFILSYFSLHTKIYFPTVTIDVPIPGVEALYYDIGHGFHDIFSVPVQNGKADLHNGCLNIRLIKRIGIRKSNEYLVAQHDITKELLTSEDNFKAFNFYPERLAKTFTVRPILFIFWSFFFSIIATISYIFYNKSSLVNFISNQKTEIIFFSLVFLLYVVIAWIAYPTLSYDSIVQQQAISGKTSLVFSALYRFIADSAWLLFSDPILGIVILEIVCMASLMLYLYKIFAIFHMRFLGLFFTSLLSISPVVYRFISMTEQREVSGIFAVLSLVLSLYSITKTKRTKTYIASVLFSLGAVAMRYDFIGYFVSVVLLPTLPWIRQTNMLKIISVCFFSSIFAICLSFGLDYLDNPEAQKYLITVHRPLPFYFGNFSYLIKEDMLTSQEKKDLSQYVEIEKCKQFWDGFSISSFIYCSPKEYKIEALNSFVPIAKKYFFAAPFLYVKNHFFTLKKSIKMVLHWEIFLDDYNVLLDFLSNKIDPQNIQYIPAVNGLNSQYISSARMSLLSYNSYRESIISYVNNKIVRIVLFTLLFSLSLFVFCYKFFVKKICTTFCCWTMLWISCCFFLGPLCKFFSIVLLAPFIVSGYFTDVILFTFTLFLTYFSWIIPLAQNVNKKVV